MSENYKTGMKVPDFNFVTPWKNENNFYDCLNSKKGFLLFLRYYGCLLCQLDIANLIKNYSKFAGKNTQIFVVLQSKPETLNSQMSECEIPFTIICDPERSLYKIYNVMPAKDNSEFNSPALFEKIKIANESEFKHGIYEGNELQLPAAFLINEKKNLEFAYYGKDPGDIPNCDELLSLI